MVFFFAISYSDGFTLFYLFEHFRKVLLKVGGGRCYHKNKSPLLKLIYL